MAKHIITGFILLYLALGAGIALYFYGRDLQTFRCVDPSQPHGYVTYGTRSFVNPDPARCHRRAFTWQSAAGIPIHVVLGVPLGIGQYMESRYPRTFEFIF